LQFFNNSKLNSKFIFFKFKFNIIYCCYNSFFTFVFKFSFTEEEIHFLLLFFDLCHFLRSFFNSPDPKGHVSIWYHWTSVRPLLTFCILIFSSETTGPIGRLAGGVIGYDSERGPHKDHSTKVWSQLAKLVSEEKILNDFFWSNFRVVSTVLNTALRPLDLWFGWLVHFKVHYQKSQSKMFWVFYCCFCYF
jgi:hypothetical protein